MDIQSLVDSINALYALGAWTPIVAGVVALIVLWDLALWGR